MLTHGSKMSTEVKLSLRDSLYLSDKVDETTFKYDKDLPSLPVPNVQHTVHKLLESIKPIAEPDDKGTGGLEAVNKYRDTERKALQFLQDANVDELQNLLEKRASEYKNWLEAWWLEFAYLRSRKPLLPYSSMAAPLPILTFWPPQKPGQPGYDTVRIERAALSTFFQLCFWRMLRHERMRPMIHKGAPWSMSQFRYLFNTSRKPGEPIDELTTCFKTIREGAPESVEIIVLHRGHIFAIRPVTMKGPGQACILTAPQIEVQLRFIVDWCAQRPAGAGVGALTTSERSVWKEARDELASVSDRNREILDRIDKALSVLVLDDNEPNNGNETLHQTLCGDPTNRWADKSITSIAFKNGTFGASADHTPYDGFCTGIMTHYMITSIEECGGKWQDNLGVSTSSAWAIYQPPELLQFQISPQISNSIRDACESFAKISSTIETVHDTFVHYGKDLLKEHRLHPEAFVQCAIHATYYAMYGRMAPTYVTASTRRFYNGRTETCRSCYPEMRDFAKLLSGLDLDNNISADQATQTYASLKCSVEKFQKLMNEASSGQGCDRHLMGLYLVAMLEGKKIPELFDDELVQRTNNYVLSTSCSGYWNVCGGVPPLVEDGYGCFYGIEDHAITFCITAYKTCSDTDVTAFYSNLHRALVKMQRIMLTSSKL